MATFVDDVCEACSQMFSVEETPQSFRNLGKLRDSCWLRSPGGGEGFQTDLTLLEYDPGWSTHMGSSWAARPRRVGLYRRAACLCRSNEDCAIAPAASSCGAGAVGVRVLNYHAQSVSDPRSRARQGVLSW